MCQRRIENPHKQPRCRGGVQTSRQRSRGQHVLLAAVALACAGPTPHEAPAADETGFSSARAWGHLSELSELGPRVTGTREASRARQYFRTQLEEIGATVSEIRVPLGPEESPSSVEAVHLIALLPGDSSDRFMLAAAYDTPRLANIEFIGANSSASGPALVLELARALSVRSRPYTVMVVLLDGDFVPLPADTSSERAARSLRGSRALARALDEDGTLADIRLAAFFQQVGDEDLSIARDLRSHTIYRDEFFDVASELGHQRAFRADAAWESPVGSHRAFIEAGLPRVVLISDDRFGGSSRPGRYAWNDRDTLEHCAPESLAAVGEVSLVVIDSIALRLARMDRFPAESLAEPTGAPSSASEPSKPASR
jgi:hypothetical protein